MLNVEKNNEAGAALLEFAIAASLALTIAFVSLDLFLSFYRFLLLSDATTTTARNFSVLMEGGEAQLNNNASVFLKQYIQNSFGQNSQNIVVNTNKINHGTHCTIQISTQWNNACLICSITQIVPQTFQEVAIEDECIC